MPQGGIFRRNTFFGKTGVRWTSDYLDEEVNGILDGSDFPPAKIPSLKQRKSGPAATTTLPVASIPKAPSPLPLAPKDANNRWGGGEASSSTVSRLVCHGETGPMCS